MLTAAKRAAAVCAAECARLLAASGKVQPGALAAKGGTQLWWAAFASLLAVLLKIGV